MNRKMRDKRAKELAYAALLAAGGLLGVFEVLASYPDDRLSALSGALLALGGFAGSILLFLGRMTMRQPSKGYND